jgi:hypothetical protein
VICAGDDFHCYGIVKHAFEMSVLHTDHKRCSLQVSGNVWIHEKLSLFI